MRKICLLLAAFALISAAGCEKKSEENDGGVPVCPDLTPEKDITEQVQEPKEQKNTEPSQMYIFAGGEKVMAMRGSYSWRVDGADGKSQYTVADGIYPLDAKKYMPCITLAPAVSSNDVYTAELIFDVSPKKVTAQCWPTDAFEDRRIDAESVTVDTIEIDYADGRNSCDYILHLKNENYIYHITAEWERDGYYAGSAEYCFYTQYAAPETSTVEIDKTDSALLCGYPKKEYFD